MNQDNNIVFVDPTKYNSPTSTLGFYHECCNGCQNEYSSHLNDENRVDKCLYCLKEKLDPAYRRRVPFSFDRKTGEIIERKI